MKIINSENMYMKVIKRRQIIKKDPWRYDTGEQGLPPGPVFVPLKRWRQQREGLLSRAQEGQLGLRLQSNDDVGEIAGDLEHFSAIALVFTAFTDGRGYSQARLLRTRYGYTGQIRAIGDIRRDQLFFLERCGVDTVELASGQDIESSLSAYNEISVRLQPAADKEIPGFHRRFQRVGDARRSGTN
jgi:uncharacterized protein (DUF934 family)